MKLFECEMFLFLSEPRHRSHFQLQPRACLVRHGAYLLQHLRGKTLVPFLRNRDNAIDNKTFCWTCRTVAKTDISFMLIYVSPAEKDLDRAIFVRNGRICVAVPLDRLPGPWIRIGQSVFRKFLDKSFYGHLLYSPPFSIVEGSIFFCTLIHCQFPFRIFSIFSSSAGEIPVMVKRFFLSARISSTISLFTSSPVTSNPPWARPITFSRVNPPRSCLPWNFGGGSGTP